MKSSRAKDLTHRGFLPTPEESSNVACIKLEGDPATWPSVDVILHKSSDYLALSANDMASVYYQAHIPHLQNLRQVDDSRERLGGDTLEREAQNPRAGFRGPIVVDAL